MHGDYRIKYVFMLLSRTQGSRETLSEEQPTVGFRVDCGVTFYNVIQCLGLGRDFFGGHLEEEKHLQDLESET
jgi:hypothetical protein